MEAVEIVVHLDQSQGDILVVTVAMPEGMVWIMGKMVIDGNRLTVDGMHIHGDGVWTNDPGPRRLKRLAQAVMENLDVDEAIVSGAERTSGANPGRRPRSIRFSRQDTPKLGL